MGIILFYSFEGDILLLTLYLYGFEMEKHKQSIQREVEENYNLRDRIKELEEKLINNLTLSNMENKLDINPIKEEINKLIELNHERNKRALNLVIFGIKEQ
jgi:hypothetical protein